MVFYLFHNFSLDREDKLQRINHSVPQRDSHFSIPIEQVDGWYQALGKFVELIHEESVSFKTKPGNRTAAISIYFILIVFFFHS